MLRRLLAHPLTRGVALDDPRTSELRREIIASKPFLRAIYDEWYAAIRAALPRGRVLELGSGGGFLKDVIRSEVFYLRGVDAVLDARALPFRDASLDAIVMVDVLHHIPDAHAFFREAARAVRDGGRVIMIEPWVTPWSRLVYRFLHHEPFDPRGGWTFPSTGPLSGANGALPWIVFARDREVFAREHPEFAIESIETMMPLRYLASGGVSLRALAPRWSYGAFRFVDRLLRSQGMFARIVLGVRRQSRRPRS